jgi:hypothetical protein
MDIIRCTPESTTVNFARKETSFPYRGVPSRAAAGDLLFLANHGTIVGAALILGIDVPPPDDEMEYLEQGAPGDPGSYRHIRVGKVRRVEGSPPYIGHMGIRYVDRLKDARMRRFLKSAAKTFRAGN